MITYNGDPVFKKQFVAEVVKSRKLDMVLQGTYGQQNGRWRGCAVACSLRSLDILKGRKPKVEYNDHPRFEREGLWPEWLARLEDAIFENLPQEQALLWPEKLAKAVPVGVDIEPVKWKFCAFLLSENIERVLVLDIKAELKEQVVSAIRQVLAIHENAISTGVWNESAARSAEMSAAESAAAARFLQVCLGRPGDGVGAIVGHLLPERRDAGVGRSGLFDDCGEARGAGVDQA